MTDIGIMGSTMTSLTRRKDKVPDIKESFALPRSIVSVLRQCAKKYGGDSAPCLPEMLKYLWINISAQSKSLAGRKRRAEGMLSPEDWLNVVDEAASLGVKYIVICVGESFEGHPELWKTCHWAQRSYGIDVGIHTCASQLRKPELDELKRLEADRTWLFVNNTDLSAFEPAKKAGIKVLGAQVDHEEHSPPCDMSEQMLFVGPEGVLYTCGLVLNNDHFRMGHISERPLEEFVKDPALPHSIPKWAPHRENGCDACPPIMVKRMAGAPHAE